MATASGGACLSGAWRLCKTNALTHIVSSWRAAVVGGISGGLLVGPERVG